MKSKRKQDLFLVRHADAEDDQGLGDAARSLTAKGRSGFRAQVRELANEILIDGLLTGPAVRAVQTAEILAEALGATKVVVKNELDTEQGSAEGIVEVAKRLKGSWAMVGHNPTITEALAELLEVEPGAVEFPKGAVAALRRDKKGWHLLWSSAPGRKGRVQISRSS